MDHTSNISRLSPTRSQNNMKKTNYTLKHISIPSNLIYRRPFRRILHLKKRNFPGERKSHPRIRFFPTPCLNPKPRSGQRVSTCSLSLSVVAKIKHLLHHTGPSRCPLDCSDLALPFSPTADYSKRLDDRRTQATNTWGGHISNLEYLKTWLSVLFYLDEKESTAIPENLNLSWTL